MGTVIAWLLENLTSKIALPIIAVMLVANIGTGIALEITRITLQHRTEDLAAEKATHAADIATYQAATAQAKALDQQHALTVKEGQDQVTTEKQHDLENQLASARAVAANFVRQHPAPAVVPSGRDNPPVPAAPDATDSVDRAPGSTVIPATDADACAIAYTVAVGWQQWYAKEMQVIKDNADPKNQISDLPPVSLGVPDPRLEKNLSGSAPHQPERVPDISRVSVERHLADPANVTADAYSLNLPNVERPADLRSDN